MGFNYMISGKLGSITLTVLLNDVRGDSRSKAERNKPTVKKPISISR
jgi:hypothetical protein